MTPPQAGLSEADQPDRAAHDSPPEDAGTAAPALPVPVPPTMELAVPPAELTPPDRPSRLRRILNLLLGKAVTLVLAAVALALGFATFALLSSGAELSSNPGVSTGVMLANVAVLLLLGAVLAGRLTRVWVERRRGSAGSRMHVRLVLLFSVVAVTPAIVVAVFAAVFFNLGIQAWFNDRVRTALEESLQASQGYLEEHRNNIRGDALAMANDLSRAGEFLANDPNSFAQVLGNQTFLRGLTEAVIFDPITNQRIASAGIMVGLAPELPPREAVDAALNGDVAVIKGRDGNSVRAVVRAHVDELDGLCRETEGALEHRLRLAHERDHRAVGLRAGVHVEHGHAGDRRRRPGRRLVHLRPSSVRNIGNALHQLHRNLQPADARRVLA